MEGLGINIGYLLIQILSFVILFLALRGWLYEPILNVLEERKKKIAKGLEDARQAGVARENADTEAKRILDEARADVAKIRSEAASQAEKQAAGIIAKANEDAKGMLVSARSDAEVERDNILADLRDQVAAISIAAANKLVGESLDEKRQHELLADFFAAVPAGVSSLTGERAEITSAMPLTDAEKSQVKKNVKAASVEYKVDPSILGGLIVRVGDQVVDNSVANKMTAMRASLR